MTFSQPIRHGIYSGVRVDPYIPNKATKLSVFLCYLSSAIFSGIFLGVLMVIALFNHAWFKLCNRNSRHTPPYDDAPTDKSFIDSLISSSGEKKLIFDLKHYLNLSGFDLVEYKIFTKDGFELILHRILIKNEPEFHRSKRYPVLMIHGLMQSAAAYCTSGDYSVALCLVRDGYDVWLGNNRGGFNPVHKKYNAMNPKMWRWGIKEMGTIDIPCMIDFIISKREYIPKRSTMSVPALPMAVNVSSTGCKSLPVSRSLTPQIEEHQQKIALVAHSQGTTQVFYALAKDLMPELADRLSSFSALSPAVFGGPLLDRWFLKLMRPMGISLYRFFFGHHAFIGAMSAFHSIMPERLYTYFGYIMFNYLLGWDDKLWNGVYRSRQFLFSPVYVSADLMYWWLGKNGFASEGCIFDQSIPQWFNHLPPLQVFVPGRDNLVNPFRFVNRLKSYENPSRLEIVDLPNYSHLDVLWASDVANSVAKPMSKFIWSCVDEKEMYDGPSMSSM